MKRNEVAVDSKGRVSLSWRIHTEHTLYLAEEHDSGLIILTPGALVPAVVRIPEPLPDFPSIEDVRRKLEEYQPWKDFFPYGGKGMR